MKLAVNIDSTSLSHSACILDFYRTVIGSVNEQGVSDGGYKAPLSSPNLTYGIAMHKYLDVAYKTNGNLPIARKHARELFDNIPTKEEPKKQWLSDGKHLDISCTNVWTEFVQEEQNFDLLQLVLPCYKCKGVGSMLLDKEESGISQPCPHCKGAKNILQPATEVTFSIKYYEDDNIIVNLCGTIDKIGKFRNGCYAIGDWKTTSTWDNTGYFQQYEMSRQLRMYSLAIKLMAQMYPDSVLGKLGATQLGCFIDAIFLNKDPNATKVVRSDVYVVPSRDLEHFQMTLDDKIKQLSQAVKTGYLPKEGVINGSCIKWQAASEKNFVKCSFWDCCKNPDNVAEMLLNRDFKRTQFDPLKYNEL